MAWGINDAYEKYMPRLNVEKHMSFIFIKELMFIETICTSTFILVLLPY